MLGLNWKSSSITSTEHTHTNTHLYGGGALFNTLYQEMSLQKKRFFPRSIDILSKIMLNYFLFRKASPISLCPLVQYKIWFLKTVGLLSTLIDWALSELAELSWDPSLNMLKNCWVPERQNIWFVKTHFSKYLQIYTFFQKIHIYTII